MQEMYGKVSCIVEMYDRFYMRMIYGKVFYIVEIYVRFYMREMYAVLHAGDIQQSLLYTGDV